MAVISKTYSRILAILLAWLGFSCDSGKTEYGSPSATYKAKGTVVSQTDSKPIKGMRVVMTEKITLGGKAQYFGLDSAYTDINGNFNLSNHRDMAEHIYLQVKDVDGEENGAFANREIELKYENKDFTGGKGWYKGEAEKDLGTIQMEIKK